MYVGIAHAHTQFPTAMIFFTSVSHQNFAFRYQRLLILQEQRETNAITYDQCKNFSYQSHTSTSGSLLEVHSTACVVVARRTCW